jgi:hypothetical protein
MNTKSRNLVIIIGNFSNKDCRHCVLQPVHSAYLLFIFIALKHLKNLQLNNYEIYFSILRRPRATQACRADVVDGDFSILEAIAHVENYNTSTLQSFT